MGKKKLQGADGMNFQLQLTIKGLESINLPEENLTNESGNDIMKISCWGGKLSAYVTVPNCISGSMSWRETPPTPFLLRPVHHTRKWSPVRISLSNKITFCFFICEMSGVW